MGLQTKADKRTRCMDASASYIEVKKPSAVLLEQVPGVIRNKRLKKTVFNPFVKRFLGKFLCFDDGKSTKIKHSNSDFPNPRLANIKDKSGRPFYQIHAKVLDASQHGLPQKRLRLLLVALRRKKMVNLDLILGKFWWNNGVYHGMLTSSLLRKEFEWPKHGQREPFKKILKWKSVGKRSALDQLLFNL